MKLRKHKRIFIFSALFLIFILFVPFRLTIAPERNLKIVFTDGSPITNATVRQICHQYSLNERHDVDLNVDGNGRVFLPKRFISTSAYSLITGAINEFSSLGLHASYFSDENIAIFVEGHKTRWFYNGKGLENGIIEFRKK